MVTYVLPNPRPIELALLKKLSGSVKQLAEWKEFPSGEIFVRAPNVDDQVCVIGRTEPPAENFFRTMLLLDTVRRAGAKGITLILPYFAYARQDRQNEPGDPVTSACLTRVLAGVGADRIVTLDLHSFRIAENSPMPIENVSVMPDMAAAMARRLKGRKFAVVAPDRGGQARADLFARALGLNDGAVWVEKNRDAAGHVTARRIVGHLSGRTCVIVDDILDTGGTVKEAVRLMRQQGCREIHLCVVHPISSGDAKGLVRRLGLESIIVADAVPTPKALLRMRKVKVVSAADRLAAAAIGQPVKSQPAGVAAP